MKKLLLVAALLSLSVNGFAALLTQGTSEISVSGVWDFRSINKRLIDAEIFYGYFIMDQIEVGPRASFTDDDLHRAWSIGVAGEFNFDLSELEIVPEIVPFVGASLSVAGASLEIPTTEEEKQDDNGLNLGLEGGVKFFITDNLAISTSLSVDACTGKIYADEGELKNTDSRLNIGMRYYF
ncbi:MAG: hypothetical protein A2X46_01770 [Lentisphaerae bacterium GWF2_57_35]|nr:MAG: hypothetical protein A2X46_01770 [Lentisphaerae bacterium GWF2_57_35]